MQEIVNAIFKRYDLDPAPYWAASWIDSMVNANRIEVSQQTRQTIMFEFKNTLLAYRRDYGNMEWGGVSKFEIKNGGANNDCTKESSAELSKKVPLVLGKASKF